MSDSSFFLPTTSELRPLPDASDALPLGSRVAEFEIRAVVGVGGFGIVYRAWDLALEREVALKEYMPIGMVGRGANAGVILRAKSYEENFLLGLRSFVNESRLLARFDHPALVKVYRFWEANGTAYMAMPFYEARTLRQRQQDLGTPPATQEWFFSMIEPLLGALEEIHRADVYHRDIAPDNILWCSDDRPVLLDFGAARHALTDRTQSLTAILKPQFAPIEQYAEAQSMRQGPWTDVFALASTCYFMLAGRPPLPATARVLDDTLTPLAQLAPAGFSSHVLAALDWAMAVRPLDRPQSIAILRDALHGRIEVPMRAQPAVVAPQVGQNPAAEFEKTVQSLPRELESGLPQLATSLDGTGAQSLRVDGARRLAILRTVKPVPSLLLTLSFVTAGAYAWVEHWPWEPVPTADAAAEVATLASPSAPSSPLRAALPASGPASASPDNPAKAVKENSGTPVRNASAATRPTPAPESSAATSVTRRSQGPREVCVDSKAANLNSCVRRLCKTESRFKGNSACVHPQRQEAAWWWPFGRAH